MYSNLNPAKWQTNLEQELISKHPEKKKKRRILGQDMMIFMCIKNLGSNDEC